MPVPHCEKCRNYFSKKLWQYRNRTVRYCKASRLEDGRLRAIDGAASRTSPAWCPRRKAGA